MTIQKRYVAASSLAFFFWFVMVDWGVSLLARFPFADYVSAALAASTAIFLLIYRTRTTKAPEKELCGRMLCYLVAGVTVAVCSTWLR